MSSDAPKPLTDAEQRRRRGIVTRLARKLGFVGRVEYRHVLSRSGGAQYCQVKMPKNDVLIVYADAFDRDQSRADFSLTAIVAHECGHHLIAHHPRIAPRTVGISIVSEEILGRFSARYL
jgi:ribosomal protein L18